MKNCYTILLAFVLLLMCPDAFSQIKTINDYWQVLGKTDVAQKYGSSVCLCGNQLFVGGMGSTEVPGVVDIWDVNTKKLVQTLDRPDDVLFFGYGVAASSQYLAVVASKSKKVMLYNRQGDGRFESSPFHTISITNIPYVSIDGSILAVCDKVKAIIYEISQNNGYSVCNEVFSETISGVNYNCCSVSNGIAAFSNQSKGVVIYEKSGSSWEKKATLEPNSQFVSYVLQC